MRVNKHILLLVLILIVSSCKKDLTDLNTDPNNPQNPDPELLFKHSVKRGMSNYLTSSNLEYNGIQHWVMYFSTRGGINPTTPYPAPSGGDAFWSENYIDAMNNAQVIIDFEDSDIDITNHKAAASIWKSYLMHRLTDLWGSAPYSEAFLGNPELNFAPSYDSQQEIYVQLLTDLKLAAEDLSTELPFYDPTADLLFDGNINGWIEFANSLRFRLAMRISNVFPDLTAEVLTDLEDEALFTDNETSAAFQFNSTFHKPLYEAGAIRAFEGTQYINPSKFLVDGLLETNDPRTPYLLEKTSLSQTFSFIDEYNGVPNLLPFNSEEWDNYNLDAQLGDPQGEWGDVSRIGKWYLNDTRPMPILSYSELCFLQAEAALNGLWNGDATALFQEGVRSHMNYMNFHNELTSYEITESDITSYLSQFPAITQEEISTQKWVLFAYENALEAYAELRRTGFPTLVDYYDEEIDYSVFPLRLTYPNTEFAYNRDNYLDAVSLQGADNQLTPLWWDAN